MSDAAPAIYAAAPVPVRLSVGQRLSALVIAGACLAVLVTAMWVEPHPRGVGSHTGLGLHQCQFLARSGLPCPSCGMTTSFAWFVRGNLLASLYVQPMGTVLAVLAAVTAWAGLYIGATGRPVHRLLRFIPGRYYVFPLLLAAVAGWAWKIFIQLRGIDGWQ
jgi:hypothetical protein